ncbi:MAG: glucosamine-6-phosphate deaminase [Limisphaerales bacterium]
MRTASKCRGILDTCLGICTLRRNARFEQFPVEVIIQPNPEAAAGLVARIVAHDLRANPHLVLGLATGSTMERVYRHLVVLHKEEHLDFSLCSTFNLDEYVGLLPSDPNSYRHYMEHHLFRHVNIDSRNTHLPNGMAADLEAECRNYEGLIHRFGGIDLQLLGIGKAGHIGFNEPLSALRSRTRVKALTPTTIKQNALFFGGEERMPRRAITMGVGTIIEARRCILLAIGESKAEVVASAVEGPITSMVTASALQLHQKCTVVVDEPAAGKLKETDYYRWIFENEPEWEGYR